jgi:hypothetical protein
VVVVMMTMVQKYFSLPLCFLLHRQFPPSTRRHQFMRWVGRKKKKKDVVKEKKK